MTIPFLIDKQDTSQIVRDQIGAILLSEAASQLALAISGGKDPLQWTFNTFIERSNPWADFLDAETPQPPVINVMLEDAVYDMGRSTTVGTFVGTSALFNIDCYGHGMSANEAAGAGHVVGDEMGSFEAQRVACWVRNVLVSAEYIYLGMQGTVHRRWVEALRILPPSLEGRELQQVVVARLPLRVDFNETAPQHVEETLELISATIKRKETGEIYFVGDYPQ